MFVFTPTNASWLNWIKCEFTALRSFALNGTDHRSHDEQNTAIGAYIRWHNHRARPKQHFAINSKIRQPDYQINTARQATRMYDYLLGCGYNFVVDRDIVERLLKIVPDAEWVVRSNREFLAVAQFTIDDTSFGSRGPEFFARAGLPVPVCPCRSAHDGTQA